MLKIDTIESTSEIVFSLHGRLAGPWVGLTEIAERERRTVPGVAGDDFRLAFAAVARAGYRGPITIEGNGTPDELRRAFAVIDTQSREALAAALAPR